MKIVGLITEYNPFHNGHKYHLDEALKRTGSDYAIVVMSGNFVQPVSYTHLTLPTILRV